jgi:hypothetical protein
MEAHDKGAIHCRVFFKQAHGKEPCLPCVFRKAHDKQPMFAVRFSGRRTANNPCLPCVLLPAHGKGCPTPFGAGAVSCFWLPCVVKKRTTKIVYHALSDVAHGKGASPCKMLPYALCRAPRQKTHDKEFAVRFWAFAVRSWRTAKPRFPVVTFESLIFLPTPTQFLYTPFHTWTPPVRES